MGDIYDFNTGEIIKIGKIPKRKDTSRIIESLYQRRHQIGDIIVIYNDKLHGNIGFGMACREDVDRRILASWFNDYMSIYFEPPDEA